MRSETLELDTSTGQFHDITKDVQRFVQGAGDGLVNVFAPHATAGIALMETGSGSERDLADVIERILPRDNRYTHSHGSKGHGADHLLPALIAPSITIPVAGGEMKLGTWQSIVLIDTNRDNPHRRIHLTFMEE
jgi:secondary thiamine-phosphate synthase enzyme